MIKDIGDKMEKYPGSLAKISQDFNIMPTFSTFFFPHPACISAYCAGFEDSNVTFLSTDSFNNYTVKSAIFSS